MGIRDHWTKEDSPLQTSLRGLQELLGHAIVVEPEWALLIAELDTLYADKANLIAVIAGCVQVWAKSMTELLKDSAHEAWTEKVLEKVPVRMRVFVDVASSAQAVTVWSEERGGFVISLPKKQVYQPAELFPVFRGDLLVCLDLAKARLPERKAAASADDWEGVEVDSATGTVQVEAVEAHKSLETAASAKVEFLPNVASLPRPDQLFLKPPYYLTLLHGHQQIELHCSHSPTLQLLAEYFKRWCRVNHADTRNVCGRTSQTSKLSRPLTTTLVASRCPGETPSVCFWTGRDV